MLGKFKARRAGYRDNLLAIATTTRLSQCSGTIVESLLISTVTSGAFQKLIWAA